MLRVLRMAWRNLLRHKARTALMVSIVSFGSLVVLLMWGITAGVFDSVTATRIESTTDRVDRVIWIGDGRIERNGRRE